MKTATSAAHSANTNGTHDAAATAAAVAAGLATGPAATADAPAWSKDIPAPSFFPILASILIPALGLATVLARPSLLLLWVPLLFTLVSLLLLLAALAVDFLGGRAPGVPSPPTVPLFNQSIELHGFRHRALDWLTRYSQQFEGRTWTFKCIFRPRVYVICEPRNVEHILKTNFNNYGKGAKFRSRMQELLGDGIFNVDGRKWYEQRKISSHLFTHRNFKQRMLSTINRKIRTLCTAIGTLVDEVEGIHNGKLTERGAIVNFSSLFLRYTLDSIGEIAFGKDIGSMRGESSDFVSSFDFIQYFLNELVLKPPGYAQYCRYFTPDGERYTASLNALNAYVKRMVVEAKAASPEELAARGDLLALFLSRTDGEGREFSDAYLRDIVVNMTIAGRDTTAYALAWAIWLLATHPEAQAKARAEAQAAFARVTATANEGEDDEEHHFGGLSYEGIDGLQYIDAVFTETLRLYPSVPKNPKCVLHDDVLPDGTRVRAGDYVMYAPYVMARLPSLWGPDCERFNPTRHLTGRPRPSPYLWPAFQAGPRICLGQKLAYMEAKAVLAIFLANYEVAPVPLTDLPAMHQRNNKATHTTEEKKEEEQATGPSSSPPRPATTQTTDASAPFSPPSGHTSDEEEEEEEEEEGVMVNKPDKDGDAELYAPRLVQNALTTPMEGEGCLLRVTRLPTATWREEAAAAGGVSTHAQ